MAEPIDHLNPEQCLQTQRLMTEWFEYPEYTNAQLKTKAFAALGEPEREFTKGGWDKVKGEERELMQKISSYIGSTKHRKWRGNMSQHEVAVRMNEATKMVSPSNPKFLDQATQERTGLELNPLWQMETLYRSGILSPKEQMVALKELATYTHSKAPSLTQNTNTNVNPEDWLMELAKSEYAVVDPVKTVTAARGSGPLFDANRIKKTRNTGLLHNLAQTSFAEIEAELNSDWLEPDDR